MGDRGGPILGMTAFVIALSAEAWQALGNVIGQALLVVGSLGAILLSSRLNKGKRLRRAQAEAGVDEERAEWDRERAALGARVKGLANELEFQTQQVAFGVQQRDFERRRANALDEEKQEAWTKCDQQTALVNRLRQQVRELGATPVA